MKYSTAILGLFFLLSFSLAGFAITPDQPFMEAARADLQKAKAELLVAEHNKGGHRAKALELVNAAIAEVNKGIAFDRKHNHTQALSAEEVSAGPLDQPHMQSALDHLKDAKSNLEKATPDKGGHRVKALELVNTAISEVNAGIKAGS